ncbi:MAG: hypothetical protein PWP65_276 [Clostridia bacterium]|nr:hypothetical protein [Clostridia bacterium]
MRVRNKTMAFIAAVLFMSTMILAPVWAGEPPQITARAAVLMDMATGKILFAHNPDMRMAPASTTKILTALIALELGNLDDRITVGPNPPRVEGTRVYLVEGETVTLKDLLYGMMLNSGNDAALAVAEHYGGSQEGFARLMNKKAGELGAQHSHFVNPSGLSDPDHYTTARDLAVIARAAMQNPTFREIVATKTRPWRGKEWESVLINQNRLLWHYEGADGIKNGYTSEANFTLVGSATRGDQSLIAVVLDEPSSHAAEQDVQDLLDYGFREFRSYVLARKGEILATVGLEKVKNLELVAADNLAVVCKNDGSTPPKGQLQLFLPERPLQVGTVVGKMTFRHNGEVIGEVEVVNRQPIPARPLTPGDWWLRISLALVITYFISRAARVLRLRKRKFAFRRRNCEIYFRDGAPWRQDHPCR